jgi:hypothetical protein
MADAWLTIFGSLGTGLVWGWLLGWVARPLARQAVRELAHLLRFSLTAIFGTACLGGAVWAFSGWTGLISMLAGATLTFCLHVAWRNTLQGKANRPVHKES